MNKFLNEGLTIIIIHYVRIFRSCDPPAKIFFYKYILSRGIGKKKNNPQATESFSPVKPFCYIHPNSYHFIRVSVKNGVYLSELPNVPDVANVCVCVCEMECIHQRWQ